MVEIVLAAVFFGSFLALGVWIFRWQYHKADARLSEWAAQSHYTILEKRPANPPNTGPKAMRGTNKQVMYLVTVSGPDGASKRALIKIGSETTGTLSDKIEVQWEPNEGHQAP